MGPGEHRLPPTSRPCAKAKPCADAGAAQGFLVFGRIAGNYIYKAFLHEAVRWAGMAKPGPRHTFRHCFATHSRESRYDNRTVQELLSHRNLRRS